MRQKCPNTDQKKLRIWTLFTRWLFHVTALTDLILYYSIYCVADQIGQKIILHILSSFARPQVKTLIVKIRLLPRKFQHQVFHEHFFIDWQCFQYRLPNISCKLWVVSWAQLLRPLFSIQITQFCGKLT